MTRAELVERLGEMGVVDADAMMSSPYSGTLDNVMVLLQALGLVKIEAPKEELAAEGEVVEAEVSEGRAGRRGRHVSG